MKLIINDFLKIIVFTICWLLFKSFCNKNNFHNFSEALNYVPIHFIITIGYYAGITVCWNVVNIKNCEKEYLEIIDEIDEAKQFYLSKDIKYN